MQTYYGALQILFVLYCIDASHLSATEQQFNRTNKDRPNGPVAHSTIGNKYHTS